MSSQAKTKTSKTTAAAKKPAASHPSYNEMICQALKEVKDRKGVSRQAIRKYLTATYGVADTAHSRNVVARQLRRLVEAGRVSAVGARFKVLKAPEAPKKKKVKAAAATKKAVAAKKKPAVKKTDSSAKKPKAKSKKAPVKKSGGGAAAKKASVKKSTAKKPASKKSPKKSVKKAAAATKKASAKRK